MYLEKVSRVWIPVDEPDLKELGQESSLADLDINRRAFTANVCHIAESVIVSIREVTTLSVMTVISP